MWGINVLLALQPCRCPQLPPPSPLSDPPRNEIKYMSFFAGGIGIFEHRGKIRRYHEIQFPPGRVGKTVKLHKREGGRGS